MTDLTPLFNRCILIVQSELGDSIKEHTNHHKEQHRINDTFIKEAAEMYALIVSLNSFLTQIRSSYLSTNEAWSGPLKESGTLSIEDKNKIDDDFKYKVHQVYEKIKLLQTYEKKRQLLVDQKQNSGFLGSFFGGLESEDDFDSTVSLHRTQILRFLNESANTINKKFESMERKRYEREKQLNLLNFQDLEDDVDLNYEPNLDSVPIEELEKGYAPQEFTQELTQEQIVELDTENQQFLTLKTNQLQQVEKLHNSMVDIVSLQAELTYQLESQSDQISNLLDNQSQVEIDLNMGNKNLNKATTRNKKSANMIITTCLVLGCFILFVDYISF